MSPSSSSSSLEFKDKNTVRVRANAQVTGSPHVSENDVEAQGGGDNKEERPEGSQTPNDGTDHPLAIRPVADRSIEQSSKRRHSSEPVPTSMEAPSLPYQRAPPSIELPPPRLAKQLRTLDAPISLRLYPVDFIEPEISVRSGSVVDIISSALELLEEPI